jgi:hypothetical protein
MTVIKAFFVLLPYQCLCLRCFCYIVVSSFVSMADLLRTGEQFRLRTIVFSRTGEQFRLRTIVFSRTA